MLTFSHLDKYFQFLVFLWVFAEDAELTFCPYNYLVDPVIRKSMGIDIRNAVLIFDEAHNIEDISRSGPLLMSNTTCAMVHPWELGLPRDRCETPLRALHMSALGAHQ